MIYDMCRGLLHTSQHLFKCPTSPTNLTFLDLWKRSLDMANYLRTLDSFNHLPPNPLFSFPPLEPPPAAPGSLIWLLANQPTNFVRPSAGPSIGPSVSILLRRRRARAWLEFRSCFTEIHMKILKNQNLKQAFWHLTPTPWPCCWRDKALFFIWDLSL
jgi:hypothetical protein